MPPAIITPIAGGMRPRQVEAQQRPNMLALITAANTIHPIRVPFLHMPELYSHTVENAICQEFKALV